MQSKQTTYDMLSFLNKTLFCSSCSITLENSTGYILCTECLINPGQWVVIIFRSFVVASINLETFHKLMFFLKSHLTKHIVIK